MKILLFAHSASTGGAENALRNLVELIRFKHEIHIVLPVIDSIEGRHYLGMGLKCYELGTDFTLPHVHVALFRMLQFDLDRIKNILSLESYDLLISNTIAILHGNLIARLLELPHITYVHEYLDDNELLPTGLDRDGYLKLISDGSAGLIGCSSMVLSQFKGLSVDNSATLVQNPFDFSQTPYNRPKPISNRRVLQVIGQLSHRKNVVFATTVAKALKVLGIPIELDFIGGRNSAATKLEQILKKRDIHANIIAHENDPFQKNINCQTITLVCSRTEPFGLTLAESLRWGIPVLASRCGGPEEFLAPERLFDVDDVDGCARILLTMWKDYDRACELARTNYNQLHNRIENLKSADNLDDFFNTIINSPFVHKSDLIELLQVLKQVTSIPVDQSVIVKSILEVAEQETIQVTEIEINQLVELERKIPGTAVISDIKKFNAIPFGMSKSMEELYKRGLGLSIEIAATYNGTDRIVMAAFIAISLWQLSKRSREPLHILALGDGIGVDSIRLANAGFIVHYMDYDDSNMTKVAARNIKSYSETTSSGGMCSIPLIVNNVDFKYDAIVCLEVIEHVQNIESFIKFMHESLKSNGVLYISECFNGIQDRWPTHLSSNENYSGQLPFLMYPYFELIDLNRMPYSKPYVFQKCEPNKLQSINKLLRNREVMADLVRNQLDIGGV